MPNPVIRLRELRAEQVDAAQALIDAAEAEDRDLTDTEEQELGKIRSAIASLDSRIARQEEINDLDRQARPVGDANREHHRQQMRISGGEDRREDDPKRGFRHFGEFAAAVRQAALPGGGIDERLRIGAAPTSYANEGSGQDGGYLVPPDFSTTVYQHSLEEQAFLPLTDNDNVSGNGMSFPRDETTPWGSNGVRAYWEAEGAQATQTKPVIGRAEMRLYKLFGLVPVTDELLADAGALGGYLNRKGAESIRWKTNDAIVNGTGAGQPQGITKAASLVTQAKVTSQTADTIVAGNVVSMYARNLNPGRSYWLVNPDAYPQLPLMTIGQQPVFTPPNGLVQAPFGMLLGRPIILTDVCQTLGDLNDILFVDFKGYKTITKAGGIETATSMHLWFDYDVMAFRFIFRIDGQPWMSAAVTPPNSTVTRSAFVTLAARA